MYKISRNILLCLGVVILAFILGGCSGNSNLAGDNLPQTEVTSLDGQVTAPFGTTASSYTSIKQESLLIKAWQYFTVTKIYALEGETSLANASVTVVYYGTNQPVRNAAGKEIIATTDDSGFYSLSGIPSGENVEIIVTKELGTGEQVYMSAIIPDTGNLTELAGESVGNVNAATTMSALLIKQEKGEDDVEISTIDLENALNEAKNLDISNLKLLLNSEDSYLMQDQDGKILVDEDKFVGDTAYKNFKDKCLEAVNNAKAFYFPAKAMLEDVRQAGVFLENAAYKQHRSVDINMNQFAIAIEGVVFEFAEHISPMITKNFIFTMPNTGVKHEISNLPTNFETENQIITYPGETENWTWNLEDIDKGYTTEVILTNLNEITSSEGGYTVYDLEEANFLYTVNNIEDNYYFQANLSLVNSSVETVTLEESMEKIIIPTAPEFKIDGTFKGPRSGTVEMDFIFAAAANNSLTNGGVDFFGSFSTDSFSANGQINVDVSRDQDLSANEPTSASITFNGLLETNFPDLTIGSFQPSLVMPGEFKIQTENLEITFLYNQFRDKLVANSITLNGLYMDKNPNTTIWDGNLSIVVDNATDDFVYPIGSFNFDGLVQYTDFNDIELVISSTVNEFGLGRVVSNIELGRANNRLSGLIESIKTDYIKYIVIDLENQDGINFVLTELTSGIDIANSYIIDSNGVKMADIIEDDGYLKVQFLNEDGSSTDIYESLY